MGCVHTPMLLAQDAMLCILVTLLGNRVVERHHLPLGEVARVHFSLISGLFVIGWEHLLNLLEGV